MQTLPLLLLWREEEVRQSITISMKALATSQLLFNHKNVANTEEKKQGNNNEGEKKLFR